MDKHKFYTSWAWLQKRAKILEFDHGECTECRKRGRYTRAEIVHHVKHLEDFPEFALSDTYTGADGIERRQLVSVCRDCHETVCHPERLRHTVPAEPVTHERWD